MSLSRDEIGLEFFFFFFHPTPNTSMFYDFQKSSILNISHMPPSESKNDQTTPLEPRLRSVPISSGKFLIFLKTLHLIGTHSLSEIRTNTLSSPVRRIVF